ncbi:MAG: hypothetical protein JO186_05225 [Actinobacteria bacterium]|nr:hypothetical protein [Actinomycetota bacterium]
MNATSRVRRAHVVRGCCLAAGLATLTACGSKQSVDSGGFTSSQRRAAQSALSLLDQTPIPRRVVALSFQAGQAPPTCIVVPRAGTGSSFELYIAWKPSGEAYLNAPQTVIQATIHTTSVKADSYSVASFQPGSLPTREQAVLVRAMLAKPADPCQVLATGQLQLVPDP